MLSEYERAQLSSFSKNGYVLVRKFFNQDQLDQLCCCYERTLRSSPIAVTCPSLTWVSGSAEIERYLNKEKIRDKVKIYSDLALGGQNLELEFSIRMFHKPGYARETLWHQDAAYFKKNRPQINIWVPLQDVNDGNGAMRYVPGSHLHGLKPHEVRYDQGVKTLFLTMQEETIKHTVIMKAGDVVMHQELVVHGASRNAGASPRRSIVIVARQGS